MDLGLSGKRALVLSSSRGLGLGIAQALAAEGADVMLTARSADRLKAAIIAGSKNDMRSFHGHTPCLRMPAIDLAMPGAARGPEPGYSGLLPFPTDGTELKI